MKLKTLATVALGTAALVFGVASNGEFGMAQAQAQAESVRPEVGKFLKDASALYKAGKFKEALAKVRDAEGVANRTAGENYAIEGMRFSAGMQANDTEAMTRGFEALKASGKLSSAQQLQYMEAIAATYLRGGNAAKALEWSNKYFAAGGSSATMKTVQQQAQFKSGDMTAVLRDTLADIQADEKAGKVPTQDKLNTLLYAAQKKGDTGAEALATEKLLNYYPSKQLWSQALGSLQAKKGFSDRFTLDLYRLKLATGNMRGADDYMEAAQLAAQAGYPEEGKAIVDKGLSANILGQGADGAKAKRLSDFLGKRIGEAKAALPEAEKAANDAKDGNGLVSLGLGYALRGEAAKGAKMIDAGIAKGNLKRPDDAKLYLGIAQSLAGDSAKAQATWRGVRGTDGSADLARLWIIEARSGKK